MAGYRPPIDDIALALEVVGDGAWAQAVGARAPDAVGVRALLEELGRLAAEVLAPSDEVGDREGAHFDPSTATVTTPVEIRAAHRVYVAGGWGAMTHPEDVGGGGLPRLVGLAAEELVTSANLALSLHPLLTHGAAGLLERWGDERQRATWLPRLVSGEWSGTMNLTEPDAGSDLSTVRTRAVRTADGRWAVTGTKVFITWGEHDLTDNIVHLVLARSPGAAEGTAGISLFVVPKVLEEAGRPPARNRVRCIGIEHKLGIHASPTCVMEYDGAFGELVGAEGQGLAAMFTMMNAARLGIGLQGLAVSVRAHQQALDHAHQRHQGRAPGAAPGGASAIVDHPDVRRMLVDSAASIDAMRLLLLATAAATDVAEHHPDASARAAAATRVGLLTPIAKAWCTDEGVRLTSLALQVHGGMGYVEDTGVAQRYRDARIAPIYEGTNGIQAIDLVQRKVQRDAGAGLAAELAGIDALLATLPPGLGLAVEPLGDALEALRRTTAWILRAPDDTGGRRDVLAGATPYLHLAATVLAGAQLVRQAAHVHDAGHPAAVVATKVGLAAFFLIEQVAPAAALEHVVCAGAARVDVAGALGIA